MKASRTISEFLPTVSDLLDGRQASEEDALGLGIEVGSEAGISPGALMRPALGAIGPPMALAGTPRPSAADDAHDLVGSQRQSFGRLAAPPQAKERPARILFHLHSHWPFGRA